MLDPGVIATLSRRHVGKFTSVGVIRPHFLAPSLQREGRIGDHAIKLGQDVAAVKSRLPEGISSHEAKVFYTVKVEVALRAGREVLESGFSFPFAMASYPSSNQGSTARCETESPHRFLTPVTPAAKFYEFGVSEKDIAAVRLGLSTEFTYSPSFD